MEILLLRLIHIGAGAFWVGSVFTFFLFVQPAAVAVGPEATRFTYQLLHHRRLSLVILLAAMTTVGAGILLLVITSNGLDPAILFDESRLGFTVGGVAAILTLGIGGLYIFPRTRVVERIIGRVVSEGGAADVLRAADPRADRRRVVPGRLGRAHRSRDRRIVSMSTARYWGVVL